MELRLNRSGVSILDPILRFLNIDLVLLNTASLDSVNHLQFCPFDESNKNSLCVWVVFFFRMPQVNIFQCSAHSIAEVTIVPTENLAILKMGHQ